MTTCGRSERIEVRAYHQRQLNFSPVTKLNSRLITGRRTSWQTTQRQVDGIDELKWHHACDTWSLLEMLLEQEGLGWCPLTNEPVEIDYWTIGYVDCRCSYCFKNGGYDDDIGHLQKTWLFDLPNYSVFQSKFWQSEWGQWVHQVNQQHRFGSSSSSHPELLSCVVGDLFIDYEVRKKESWAIFRNPEIPLYNITQAPVELYERYGLKKPEVTGRRYHRYMLMQIDCGPD